MNKIKQFLSIVPTSIWIVGGLLLALIIWWNISDISNWWEKRKETKFDTADAAKQAQIDDLTKQRDELLARAREAEAREQIKQQESDTLRQLIEQRGGKIEQEQQKIEEARKKYEEDTSIIEAAKRGDISKYELCIRQCSDSATIGYPCPQTYCDKFKQ
jgi:hypothetical protein